MKAKYWVLVHNRGQDKSRFVDLKVLEVKDRKNNLKFSARVHCPGAVPLKLEHRNVKKVEKNKLKET